MTPHMQHVISNPVSTVLDGVFIIQLAVILHSSNFFHLLPPNWLQSAVNHTVHTFCKSVPSLSVLKFPFLALRGDQKIAPWAEKRQF